ncbi:hypothetical protein CBL_14016 [Carabus blaptoides fortunei]
MSDYQWGPSPKPHLFVESNLTGSYWQQAKKHIEFVRVSFDVLRDREARNLKTIYNSIGYWRGGDSLTSPTKYGRPALSQKWFHLKELLAGVSVHCIGFL